MSERRASERFEPERPIMARVRAALPARLIDVSERGAQVEVDASLRLHRPCDLRLEIDGEEYILPAVVRRCRATSFRQVGGERVLTFRAGLEFETLPPAALAALRVLIDRCEPQAVLRAAEAIDRAASGARSPALGMHRRVKIRIESEFVRRALEGR